MLVLSMLQFVPLRIFIKISLRLGFKQEMVGRKMNREIF